MDLPTYTSIWRIEKRLYKLYDFRLPMPLPIGQVTVFVAISVPYVVLLQILGLPFNHTLIWVYLLPPGFATWLVTRPVLESKRLPELIRSQLRYLAEPRVLCRMAPLAERDLLFVSARVWRPRASRRMAAAAESPGADVLAAEAAAAMAPAAMAPAPGTSAAAERDEFREAAASGQATDFGYAPESGHARGFEPGEGAASPARRPLGAGRSARVRAAAPARSAAPAATPPVTAAPAAPPAVAGAAEFHDLGGYSAPAPRSLRDHGIAPVAGASAPAPGAQAPARRPAVTVVGAGQAGSRPPSVERALAGPSARRGSPAAGPVTVIPGGDRPGKPDQLQRDRARAQLPIGDPAGIVVLGCTVGAGQTVTTLLASEVLASLRSGEVAAIDINPGHASLAARAQARPALSQAAMLAKSRLIVIPPASVGAVGHSEAEYQAASRLDPLAEAAAFAAATDRHELVLADPATSVVPRLLAVADQLVLVAPASTAAPGAVAMTFEWLEAHGRGDLAAGAIMVLNGVSRRSTSAVEQAERVCVGRCRAIVRIPWDEQLHNHWVQRSRPPAHAWQPRQHWAGMLSPATTAAYIALAGVIVAALADPASTAPSSPRQPVPAVGARP